MESIIGYIYCFFNPSMPDILKIGMTERTPKERLNEANKSDTWKPPTPYEIIIAKKVNNPHKKEKTLHQLLEQYTERINSKREFFRISIEEIKKFFDLIDGEEWNPNDSELDSENNNDSDLDTENTTYCRDMKKCFSNNQPIRHKIGINKIWEGKYDKENNKIVSNGISYKSLSGFAMAHHLKENPSRKTANGWYECECFKNNEWISTNNLENIN